MHEDTDIIAQYFSFSDLNEPYLRVPAGDDASVIRLPHHADLVTTVDTAVPGWHFFDDAKPGAIAYRAVAAAVSDLAAMGAHPMALYLSLCIPKRDDAWLKAFSQGLRQALDEFALPLAGGDLTYAPLNVNITVQGWVRKNRAVKREGAHAGDVVAVTGKLGATAAAVKTHGTDVFQHFEQAYYYPHIPLQFSLSALEQMHCAIDISDGLQASLEKLAEANETRVSIDKKRIPIAESVLQHFSADEALELALASDDYQLLFTCAAEHIPTLQTYGVPVTVIGTVA